MKTLFRLFLVVHLVVLPALQFCIKWYFRWTGWERRRCVE